MGRKPVRRGAAQSPFVDRIDKLLAAAGQQSVRVLFVLLVIGLLLLVLSNAFNLSSVRFNGTLDAASPVRIAPRGFVAKEVGYFWTPNWFLTTTVFLPLAIFFFLRARKSMDGLIEELARHRMVVRVRGRGIVAEDTLQNLFRDTSRFWITAAFAVGSLVALYGLYLFVVEVWPWAVISSKAESGALVKQLGVTWPGWSSRFDWTAAAAFDGRPEGSTIVFSLLAHLVAPVLGAGLLVFLAIRVLSLTHLLSGDLLNDKQYRLALSRVSEDKRCGVEVFDRMLQNIALAMFFSSLIVTSMYLENAYLATTSYGRFYEMIFEGDFGSLISSTLNLADYPGELGRRLGDLRTALASGSLADISYIAIGTFAIFVVAFTVMVWAPLLLALRKAKVDRLAALSRVRASKTLTAALDRVESLRVIPGGVLSAIPVALSILLIAGCLIWTNFIYFALAVIAVPVGALFVPLIKRQYEELRGRIAGGS